MGVTGKFSEFVQGIKENANTLLAGISRTRDLNGGDTKANRLFHSKKPGAQDSVQSKARLHSIAPNNHVIRDLVRSVVNKVLAKLQHPPTSHDVSTNGHQKLTPEDRFLKEFGDSVLQPLGTGAKPQAALKNTIGMLEKANKAGFLDQALYTKVTTRLERFLNNGSGRRQSISLDDSTPEKSIHAKLLEASSGTKKFEKFAHIEEFSNALAAHLDISPEEAKQHVEKAFQHYPKSNEITFAVNGKEITALLVVDAQGKADLQIKGKHLASGASSVVHEAFSLGSQTQVATKYATSLAADTNEEKHAKRVQEHITPQAKTTEGTTQPMTLIDLDSATVATGYKYTNDAGSPAEKEALHASEKALNNLIADLQMAANKENKAAKISEFFELHGSVLAANYDQNALAELRSSLEML